MAGDSDQKKDFTSILDLQKIQAENPQPVDQTAPEDPFAVNVLAPVEQISDFESIEQIGMMDHPEPVEPEPAPEATPEPALTPDFELPSDSSTDPVIDQAPIIDDPFASFQATETPVEPITTETITAEPMFAEAIVEAISEPPITEETPPPPPPVVQPLAKLKQYSEATQGKTSHEAKVHFPFHLRINGNFGPYERDKLLLFITENPGIMNSAELDLQFKSSRVFLPRISEYTAIKLIQELRDSGLNFQMNPSEMDSGDSVSAQGTTHVSHRILTEESSNTVEIPVLDERTLGPDQRNFLQIDQVSVVQFVKTEILEVDKAPMIQEMLERMTEVLKQKAKLKGGNALISLKREITPLRLPSQYQISLSASVIRISP